MSSTRRSARLADASSSPASSPAKTSSKRKADASPGGKKQKKIQKTLEETLPNNDEQHDDVAMKDAESRDALEAATAEESAKPDEVTPSGQAAEQKTSGEVEQTDDAAAKAEGEEGKNNSTAADAQHDKTTNGGKTKQNSHLEDAKEGRSSDVVPEGDNSRAVTSDNSATKPAGSTRGLQDKEGGGDTFVKDEKARDDKIASNMIEKGIIYFFFRGRVNVEEPEGVQDLQRTYFVLRPIPIGAKLGDGPIDDSKSNRLLALPKKVFPQSGKDRFMAFIEKGKASMSDLKREFFQGSDYETKAGDARHTPAITPAGEGVYAITKVGRNGHLAYMLTIPNEPGQLQGELGIRSKGSFVLSLKNPKNKGPANTQLPESPDFPQSIMDDFQGLAWLPVHKPEYLDYPNAQLLLIGEGQDKFGGATEAAEGEKNKESPGAELERLEDEDHDRVEHLSSEDAVYQDLRISKGEYSELKTTW